MNMYFSVINRNARRAIVSLPVLVVSILFLFCGNSSAASGPDERFVVFKTDFDITPVKNNDGKLVKDFYISGGEKDGITKSTVLDVYREKEVRDIFQDTVTKISILIGQLKVIEVFEDVAIARITTLVDSGKTPVVQYRSVMIGDYAVPVRKKTAAGKIRTIPKLSAAPLKPRLKLPDAPPKLYSMIPVSTGSGRASAPGVSFPSHVLFAFDDWKLRPEALHAIDEVMNLFNKSRDRKIVIEGHTCSLGEYGYNAALSKKRAESVSEYLINVMGIPADHIQVEYYGELFPAASNADEAGREKNRRVDIRFLPLSKKERLLRSLVKREPGNVNN